jgi:hypothetical protein
MAQQPPVGQGFLIIDALRSLRHTTACRTPLDEWSTRCKDKTQTLTTDRHLWTPAKFEPAIPATEMPHTRDLDRAVTGIGTYQNIKWNKVYLNININSRNISRDTWNCSRCFRIFIYLFRDFSRNSWRCSAKPWLKNTALDGLQN